MSNEIFSGHILVVFPYIKISILRSNAVGVAGWLITTIGVTGIFFRGGVKLDPKNVEIF